MTKQEKEIQKMFIKYEENVYQYANGVFDSKIKPYLQKYHLEFLAGNGTFYIGWTNKTPKWFINKYRALYIKASCLIDVDKIDKRIRNILQSDVEGYTSNNLGSLMPDFRPD